MTHKLFPCLWFDRQAKAAADYYCSVFKDSKIVSANSYVITCDTQEEIDHYWEKLGAGGTYNKCGWLDDKFGVSWQIVPTILGQLMNDPEKAPKAMYAFMQMTKFDIEKLINA